VNKKQRKLAYKLKFVQSYDGGPWSCRKAKINGARRVKKALSKARRSEGKDSIKETP
jgi:hypothetical protein